MCVCVFCVEEVEAGGEGEIKCVCVGGGGVEGAQREIKCMCLWVVLYIHVEKHCTTTVQLPLPPLP